MEEQVDHNAVLRVGLDLVVMKEKVDRGDIYTCTTQIQSKSKRASNNWDCYNCK